MLPIHFIKILAYMEDNPELAREISKLPFKPCHNTFIAILQKFPLSPGKEKAILKNKDPKITFGILSDHFMSLARKFEIPQVYIQGVDTERGLNRIGTYDGLGEEKAREYKKELSGKTFDLIIAVYEKVYESVRGRNNHNESSG